MTSRVENQAMRGLLIRSRVSLNKYRWNRKFWALTKHPARMLLNFKKIPYETNWVEYPDIESFYKEKLYGQLILAIELSLKETVNAFVEPS